MKTNTSMTIYARSIVGQHETWTRSVVLAVQWENSKIANVLRSGLLEADQVMIFVPSSQGAISVKPGDVLVRGTVTDEISLAFTISDLRKAYPDVVVARSVDRLDFGSQELQHWQIGAS